MIRPRRSEDLVACLAVLHAVHATDRYPVLWPQDPARWLAGRACLAAWVGATGWRQVGTAPLLLADGHTPLDLIVFVLA